MSDKQIDLNQTVYALCTQYPELAGILAESGFSEITIPGMLTTVGRFMTIPKGAMIRKLDMALIKASLKERGFTITE